ncbi:hypothetical protein [Desulfitibacter alkalitolerans]|uniref:hypothetical protein n=1 Tax=Desulfitibacter alkalitolerans TaxID=264641 RepID=UPI000480DD19|nr:hypothetical protein [Desulfitibacter alkalitolerans]
MRQVRRKTMDQAAKTFLLKAGKEGIQLSWNYYEAMLPQDGFNLLGLSCHDCLQGPCRLSPFHEGETRTICGLNKEDLVLNWLGHQVVKNSDQLAVANALFKSLANNEVSKLNNELLQEKAFYWGISGCLKPEQIINELTRQLLNLVSNINNQVLFGSVDSRLAKIQEIAVNQITLARFVNDLHELAFGKGNVTTQTFGLSSLKPTSINVCLAGLSPLALTLTKEAAGKMVQEAIHKGAEGFNLLLIGDLSSKDDINAITSAGSGEFALMTGLVDLCLTGNDNLSGQGRGITEKYHTVLARIAAVPTKEELNHLLLQAANAFTQRIQEKISVYEQSEVGEIGYALDPAKVKLGLEQGKIKGVCILGGAGNIKVTGDEGLIKITEHLSRQDILCVTYGNAAVSLGKHGYLKTGAEQGSKAVAQALGFDEGPAAYAIGGNWQVGTLMELVKNIQPNKAIAVFPELATAADIQLAFALSGVGARVLTGVRLPVDGSKVVAAALAQFIEYCEAKILEHKVVDLIKN